MADWFEDNSPKTESNWFSNNAPQAAVAPTPNVIIPRSGMQMDVGEARQFVEKPDEPVIPIPRIPQQQGILAQLGAGAVNSASQFAEAIETPQTLASLPVAPLRLTQVLFGGQMLSDVKSAWDEASQPGTTVQRGLELGTRATLDTILGLGLFKGAMTPHPVEPIKSTSSITESPITEATQPEVVAPKPIEPDLTAANRELAPVTEPPEATAEAFPYLLKSAEDQRRAELQQQPSQVRQALSLDELRLMRERNELQLQNDIAKRVTGGSHPAVDERLGQIDDELTKIVNRELQTEGGGEIPSATQEGIIEEGSQPEYQRNGEGGPPTEASGSGGVEQGGKVQGQEVATIPQWAREEMIRRGLNPGRTFNDVDLSNPSVREAINLDPTLTDEQKAAVLKTGAVGTPAEVKVQSGQFHKQGYTAVSTPESAAKAEPVGVAERYREEQQPGSVIPGVGRTSTEARDWGHNFINKGGNPYDLVNQKGQKRELWQDVGGVRAEYERLANEKRGAEAALESDPNNHKLQDNLFQADEAQRKWSKDMQPVLTRAGDALRAATRSYPREINSFSDFTDILHDNFGGDVELTPAKRAEIQKAVKGIKNVNQEANLARQQVTNTAVKKAGGRTFSFDELKADLGSTVEQLLKDCIL